MNADADAKAEARAFRRDIEKACRILGSQSPETAKKVAVEAAWVRALKNTKTAGTTLSKPAKRAAKRFGEVLLLLENALKNPHLAHDLRGGLSLDEAGCRRLRQQAEEAAKRDLQWFSHGEYAKLDAAKRAARLLTTHGVPLTTTRKTGSWCKLTAYLYGEPNADFFHHVRKVKAELVQAKLDKAELENSTTKPSPT